VLFVSNLIVLLSIPLILFGENVDNFSNETNRMNTECLNNIMSVTGELDIYRKDYSNYIQSANDRYGYLDKNINSIVVEGYVNGIASLCKGNTAVVWERFSGSRSPSYLFGSIFDNQLTRIVDDFRITENDEAQWEADIASLMNGKFVVTWKTSYQVKGGKNQITIRGRIFDPSGSPESSVFNVSTSLGHNNGASVQGLPDGGFVVLWHLYSKGVRMRIFNHNGFPRTGEINVMENDEWFDHGATDHGGGSLVPYAVVTHQGDIEVFLKYFYEGRSRYPYEYAMKFSPKGQLIGGPFNAEDARSLEGYQLAVERIVRSTAFQLEANLRKILKDDAAGLRTCDQTGHRGSEANRMWKFTKDPRMKAFLASYCKQASAICGVAGTFYRSGDRECELAGEDGEKASMPLHVISEPKEMIYGNDEYILVPDYVRQTWSSVIFEVEFKEKRIKKRYVIPLHSEYNVPDTSLVIHVGDFLPALVGKDENLCSKEKTTRFTLTSFSGEPENPAVYARIYVDGKLLYRRFLFSKSNASGFKDDRYGVRLIEGIRHQKVN
jgi:hypothetical protein